VQNKALARFLAAYIHKVDKVAVMAVAQAVIRRPLTAVARVRPKPILCGFSGGQSGSGTVLCPVSVFLPTLHNAFIYHWRCVVLATDSVVNKHFVFPVHGIFP
jgi:hypothetical protein